MTVVLDKKYTKADSLRSILKASLKLSSDKNQRLLVADEEEWKGIKLREISRLLRIALSKLPKGKA